MWWMRKGKERGGRGYLEFVLEKVFFVGEFSVEAEEFLLLFVEGLEVLGLACVEVTSSTGGDLR